MADVLGLALDAVDLGSTALSSDLVGDDSIVDAGASKRRAQSWEIIGQAGWLTGWEPNAQWAWVATGVIGYEYYSGNPEVAGSDVWMQAGRASRYTLNSATADPRVKTSMRVGASLNFVYDHPDMALGLVHASEKDPLSGVMIKGAVSILGLEAPVPGVTRFTPEDVMAQRQNLTPVVVSVVPKPSLPSNGTPLRRDAYRRKRKVKGKLPVGVIYAT